MLTSASLATHECLRVGETSFYVVACQMWMCFEQVFHVQVARQPAEHQLHGNARALDSGFADQDVGVFDDAVLVRRLGGGHAGAPLLDESPRLAGIIRTGDPPSFLE